ncbi:MAG: 6-bladed beta-propeller [Candidatus Delongbacteria bacterium]|nr:6-bladed beta-propeller [Candidatus Delongbacteria bacterium]MCG2760541.1 6-bladed beta-propeller [Candidatus Delongbacteria bacterium]
MKTINILSSMISLILILSSCSEKMPYTEFVQDGIKIVENAKQGTDKDFKYSINEIYTIKNIDNDSSFVLNFPGDRADLNSDVDKNSNLYVVDNKKSLILKFDGAGKFIKDWGGKGQGPGEFPRNPIDISVIDSENKVYVFDGSGRLTIFDTDGNFIKFFNISGRNLSAKNFYMTENGPLFGCEVYEGQYGTGDFKMGFSLYNGTEEFDVKDKIFGYLNPFDIKKIDPDNQGIISGISRDDIFIADNSKTVYTIHQFEYNGMKKREIRKKYAPIRRSKEDMEGIQDALDKFTKRTGGMFEFKEVSNLQSVITQMFIDGSYNLWVSIDESLFNEDGQEFDIFDKDGHFIKRIIVPELAGLKIRAKGNYLIAATPIEQNYTEDGKADPEIKLFKLNTAE